MTNQRIRNLTTGKLHSKVEHIYEDVEYITGEKGVMTHMLPNAVKAMTPWLQSHIKDARFWNGEYDQSHDGETELQPMNDSERAEFWKAFSALPRLF